MSAPFILCAESDLRDDIPLECAGPDGRPIVVVRHRGMLRAFPAECPHEHAPLADGDVGGGQITCCLHFWSWNLEDGQPADDETDEALQLLPVRVEGGKVLLDG